MSSNPYTDEGQRRPLHSSRSFSRVESTSPTALSRSQRANTIQSGNNAPRSPLGNVTSSAEKRSSRQEDRSGDEPSSSEDDEDEEKKAPRRKLPSDTEMLPVELASISDKFVGSLSAKVHAAPPNIDQLAEMFQNFYLLASNHIDTHISTLSSRQNRAASPSPSVASHQSTASRLRAKAASIGSKDRPEILLKRKGSEQQMLTAEEIAGRKKARNDLEYRRVALEESVERRVCEKIYSRIWRHRSTQDEAQDEKLRSKTAALSVVGIGLSNLGVDLGEIKADTEGSAAAREREVREWLDGARNELFLMNDERYPLGKLHHLKAAHKGIVDTLSHFHPSSSADEILPMLIYSLITSPPEGLNIISNLYFMQRFRAQSKIDGEAAYCLTNLEAAITFLETVDLTSLRPDELPSGPPRTGSESLTPRLEITDPIASAAAAAAAAAAATTPASSGISPAGISPAALNPTGADAAKLRIQTPFSAVSASSSSPLSPAALRPQLQLQNRRLSDIFQPPASALGAAGDAVLNISDQSLKSIGNSLEGSYKFLFGKLRERQDGVLGGTGRGRGPAGPSSVTVPKTLDQARRLVGAPSPPLPPPSSSSSSSSLPPSLPLPPADDDGGSVSGASSVHNPDDVVEPCGGSNSSSSNNNNNNNNNNTNNNSSGRSTPASALIDDRMLSLLGGRKPVATSPSPRDRSADSARSGGSGRRVGVGPATGGGGGGAGDDALSGAVTAAAAAVMQGAGPISTTTTTTAAASTAAPVDSALVESMRNLGNSLNPINRIAGIGMMRGFGRSAAASAAAPAGAGSVSGSGTITPGGRDAAVGVADGGVADLTTAFHELAAVLPPSKAAEPLPKIAPPVRRFLELKNPGELKISEVMELLRDYRRLAGALKDHGAF